MPLPQRSTYTLAAQSAALNGHPLGNHVINVRTAEPDAMRLMKHEHLSTTRLGSAICCQWHRIDRGGCQQTTEPLSNLQSSRTLLVRVLHARFHQVSKICWSRCVPGWRVATENGYNHLCWVLSLIAALAMECLPTHDSQGPNVCGRHQDTTRRVHEFRRHVCDSANVLRGQRFATIQVTAGEAKVSHLGHEASRIFLCLSFT
mmetsp:Transcript_25529/g.47969  ORF Transcript_25529/g.47969 Transcript_25529/m.47969 type:complete len:203 (+) Transcript_25529:1-609(+)